MEIQLFLSNDLNQIIKGEIKDILSDEEQSYKDKIEDRVLNLILSLSRNYNLELPNNKNLVAQKLKKEFQSYKELAFLFTRKLKGIDTYPSLLKYYPEYSFIEGGKAVKNSNHNNFSIIKHSIALNYFFETIKDYIPFETEDIILKDSKEIEDEYFIKLKQSNLHNLVFPNFPIISIYQFLRILTEPLGKKEIKYLTKEELYLFILKGFCNQDEIPKITINGYNSSVMIFRCCFHKLFEFGVNQGFINAGTGDKMILVKVLTNSFSNIEQEPQKLYKYLNCDGIMKNSEIWNKF